jgi:hypothetical protein
MSGREDMIAQAEKSLGLVGRPNYITREYAGRNGSYFAGAAWCNMAITYWARHSGNFNAVCFGKDFAYTVAHAQAFKDRGQWHVDVAGIRRGDIVFFDWNGTNSIGAIDHIGIVVDVNGRDVVCIEGNTADRCARRVRKASEIVGYGRPAYAGAKPAPKPASGGYKAPAFPSGLRPGSDSPSAMNLQRALKAAGYMPSSVILANSYGPLTQAAVRRFHAANPQYADRPGDPAIGPQGWAELHREAYA